MPAESEKLNRQPEDFQQEIKKLIQDNQLDLATKRVMDFADDFAVYKKRKYEAIDFQRRYTKLREDKRKSSSSEETIREKFSGLTFSVLEFVDLIVEEYRKDYSPIPTVVPPQENNNKSPSKSNSKDNTTNVNKKHLDQENTEKNIPKTSYEQIKESWKKQKKSSIKSSNINVVANIINITKKYSGRLTDFQLSVSGLELKFGEITSLVGENGNGKTTLLRIIAGELHQTSGIIKYPGLTKSKDKSWYKIKQQIAYVPQELPQWTGTLVDNLHFAAAIHGIRRKENEDEVDFILWRLGLDKYKNASWNEISGGFKMRFALAKALVCNPQLLILDEPLANLDVNTQLLFLQDLRYLADSFAHPKTILLSSQHLHEVENVTDNIIFIKEGSVVYNGKLKNFGEDREENAFELSCNLSKNELMDLLEEISYTQIEMVAHNQYIINTSKNVGSNEIIKFFLDNNITLKYFRDISSSTRRLFKTEK
ncbi:MULTISPECIES: ATP-binding cassette domain-containing protein [Okeania]|nr:MULTISPECIES: ATP-binding cassette domain-containing protein [Okeania]NES76252.1 ABC transporter ATP-binding protein [Okeania sp. SIO1H4]NET14170.1 ABC transporter ATP-binding protein [Okeania sp. SIO1H6]NET19695.1 ABC transporter ATP-binding protein [Okeania sp. SIO1H5]NET93621.1 ABC transporter ATP-binding protein [Okeania sp. SIO1H2]